MTTVACVIPTHGRPDFLKQALDSVLSQRGASVSEVVVVDDLGTEETRSLVEGVSRQQPDVAIAYFHRDTGGAGASASRNWGFARTTSDVVAFLDDDDLWSADHVSYSVAALRRTGAAMCLAWMNVRETDGRIAPHYSPRLGLRFADTVALNPGITGSNIVITRAGFETAGGFDENLPVSNDKDFFASFLRRGLDYTVSESRTVTHRRHAHGQLTQWNDARATGLEQYLEKYAGDVSRRDRRYLQRQIHSIRFRTQTGLPRLASLALLIVRSSPRTLMDRLWKRVRRLIGSAAVSKSASPSRGLR